MLLFLNFIIAFCLGALVGLLICLIAIVVKLAIDFMRD